MALSAGKLDRKIVLQRFTETRDAYNEPLKTWATLATRSASYEPLSDGERFRASETAATMSARFVIRHSAAVADLSPLDRLVFKGVTYEIVGVKEAEGRNNGIEITTGARADG